MPKKYTQGEWEDKAIARHGAVYDYSKSRYQGGHIKTTVTCPTHGDFSVTPAEHLSGRGCRECGKNKSIEATKARHVKSFTKRRDAWMDKCMEVHGDTYDYSHVDYVTSDTKVNIVCRTHGMFAQTPSLHASGAGCPSCGFERTAASHRLDTNRFVEAANAAHGDKYTYGNAMYIDHKTAITVTCSEHGDWHCTPSNHTNNRSGCPKCARKSSGPEQHVTDFIEAHGFEVIRHYSPTWLGGKELDIFVPGVSVAIEYNGAAFHSPDGLYGRKDKITAHHDKWKLCKENGVRLINIYDFKWKPSDRGYKYLILHALGLSERVYARQCSVAAISASDARKFMDHNHMEGTGYLGGYAENIALMYQDAPVMVMSLYDKFMQKSGRTTRTVHRMASLRGVAVVGGLSKLLAVSGGADMRLDCDTGAVMADACTVTSRYWWVKNGTLEYHHRNATQKQRLPSLIGFPLLEGDTEVSYMTRHGYLRVFGAGTARYKAKINETGSGGER